MIGRWACYERRWSLIRRLTKSSLQWFALVVCAVSSGGCQEQILHDLSEREANKIISHLSEANLAGKKVSQADGRWAIAVPSSSMVTALKYLDTRRVLSSRDAKGSAKGKSGLIPSREDQWFQYERSVAVSIEESLSALPGVLEARVHLNLPDEDPLFGSSRRGGGTGSVLLVVDGLFNADDDAISALVGGAAGLPREVVRVLKSVSATPASPQEQLPSTTTSLLVTTPVVAELPANSGQSDGAVSSVSSNLFWLAGVEWQVGALAVVALIGVLGARQLLHRGKKKVTFSETNGLELEE